MTNKIEMLKTDVPNDNGRVYPEKVVRDALVNREIPGFLETHGALSEISFMVKEPILEKKVLVGKFFALETPKGEEIKEFIEKFGIEKLKFATAGTGTTHQEEIDGKKVEVVDQFNIDAIIAMKKE